MSKTQDEDDHDEWLNLTLSIPSSSSSSSSSSYSLPPPPIVPPLSVPSSSTRPGRSRRSENKGEEEGEEEEEEERIEAPFPWAGERPGSLHTLSELVSLGQLSIEGDVFCRRCSRTERVAYDLLGKFEEVARFIAARWDDMNDRAPGEWMAPRHPGCAACGGAGCVRPVLDERNERINWLFLFLGQSLGVCTLDQLRWHCKHMNNIRTGAKDRLVYLTYIAICRQLKPELFHHRHPSPHQSE